MSKYICICEKLEKSESNEDLPQGQKEVIGIYLGTPFEADSWEEIAPFEMEVEGEIWTLTYVKVGYHEQEETALASVEDKVFLLGIIRRLFVKDTEEKIEFYTAVNEYKTGTGGEWKKVGKLSGLEEVADPVYGERWSADICLFGDDVLSPKMKASLAQQWASNQQPYGPYDGYTSGLS